jgi:hypothetical protein
MLITPKHSLTLSITPWSPHAGVAQDTQGVLCGTTPPTQCRPAAVVRFILEAYPGPCHAAQTEFKDGGSHATTVSAYAMNTARSRGAAIRADTTRPWAPDAARTGVLTGWGVTGAGPCCASTTGSVMSAHIIAAALRSQAARAVRESVLKADSRAGPKVPRYCVAHGAQGVGQTVRIGINHINSDRLSGDGVAAAPTPSFRADSRAGPKPSNKSHAHRQEGWSMLIGVEVVGSQGGEGVGARHCNEGGRAQVQPVP